MKKLLFSAALLCAVALMGACSSSKKAPKAPLGDMVEVGLPLDGAEYRTDAEFYRAVQSGTSPDKSMAKKVAIQNARQEIAATIQAEVKSVTENYAKAQQLASQDKSSYESRMTELTYTLVSQNLTGVTLVAEKLFKEENGQYRHYVCMALSKEEFKAKLLEQMEKDEKFMSDFELDQFKQLFDKKMSEFQSK